jgi:UrcA family protein
MSRSVRSLIPSIIVCTLAVLPLVSAHAATAPVSMQVGSEYAQRTVNFRTLDLTHNQGVDRLYARIRIAAESVCAPVSSIEQLKSRVGAKRCQADAIARAVADVNVPALTNLHQGQKQIVVAEH